jgi:hypothetical protein
MFGRLLTILALALAGSAPVQAQTWPTKAVRIVVPFPPEAPPTSSRVRLASNCSACGSTRW